MWLPGLSTFDEWRVDCRLGWFLQSVWNIRQVRITFEDQRATISLNNVEPSDVGKSKDVVIYVSGPDVTSTFRFIGDNKQYLQVPTNGSLQREVRILSK